MAAPAPEREVSRKAATLSPNTCSFFLPAPHISRELVQNLRVLHGDSACSHNKTVSRGLSPRTCTGFSKQAHKCVGELPRVLYRNHLPHRPERERRLSAGSTGALSTGRAGEALRLCQ